MSHSPRFLNSLKHGGYSNLGVLPGEDAKEFDAFYQSVVVEFEPSGPTECDVVQDLAKSLWRKSRLGIYPLAEAARKSWEVVFKDRDSPYWDLMPQMMKQIRHNSERLINAAKLHEDWRKTRAEVFPLVKELKERSATILNREQEMELEAEGFITLALASLGDRITIDGLNKELELYARLEARIDRLLKRLYQLKAAKQMLGLGSRTHNSSHSATPKISPPATGA